MVRLRDSWPFSLSSAPTVGNPCRPLQPGTVSDADIATTPTGTRPGTSCGGGTHRLCAWRVCRSGPVKCELDEGSRLPKIPVLHDGEDVNHGLLSMRAQGCCNDNPPPLSHACR